MVNYKLLYFRGERFGDVISLKIFNFTSIWRYIYSFYSVIRLIEGVRLWVGVYFVLYGLMNPISAKGDVSRVGE